MDWSMARPNLTDLISYPLISLLQYISRNCYRAHLHIWFTRQYICTPLTSVLMRLLLNIPSDEVIALCELRV